MSCSPIFRATEASQCPRVSWISPLSLCEHPQNWASGPAKPRTRPWPQWPPGSVPLGSISISFQPSKILSRGFSSKVRVVQMTLQFPIHATHNGPPDMRISLSHYASSPPTQVPSCTKLQVCLLPDAGAHLGSTSPTQSSAWTRHRPSQARAKGLPNPQRPQTHHWSSQVLPSQVHSGRCLGKHSGRAHTPLYIGLQGAERGRKNRNQQWKPTIWSRSINHFITTPWGPGMLITHHWLWRKASYSRPVNKLTLKCIPQECASS